MRLTHRHHRLVALALLFAAVAMLISPAHAQEKIEGKIDEKPALPDKTPVAIAKGTRVFIVSILTTSSNCCPITQDVEPKSISAYRVSQIPLDNPNAKEV